jgi:hypothetical protein
MPERTVADCCTRGVTWSSAAALRDWAEIRVWAATIADELARPEAPDCDETTIA